MTEQERAEWQRRLQGQCAQLDDLFRALGELETEFADGKYLPRAREAFGRSSYNLAQAWTALADGPNSLRLQTCCDNVEVHMRQAKRRAIRQIAHIANTRREKLEEKYKDNILSQAGFYGPSHIVGEFHKRSSAAVTRERAERDAEFAKMWQELNELTKAGVELRTVSMRAVKSQHVEGELRLQIDQLTTKLDETERRRQQTEKKQSRATLWNWIFGVTTVLGTLIGAAGLYHGLIASEGSDGERPKITGIPRAGAGDNITDKAKLTTTPDEK